MTGILRLLRQLRVLRFVLPLALILPYAAESWGQAPAGAITAPFGRITFATYDQWAYVTHPYYQITGDTDFKTAHGASSGSFTAGPAATDVNASIIEKLLHAAPPFGFEWGQGTGIFLPKAFSVGFDFFHFYQYDTIAARSGTVPPIATDTYLYNASVRFFAFDPTEPGINYFGGVGVGILDGTMRAKPFTGRNADFVHFSQNPFGTTRLGLEAKGENFGFRYEMILVNADRVNFDKNPYPNSNLKTVDYSGVVLRLGLYYEIR